MVKQTIQKINLFSVLTSNWYQCLAQQIAVAADKPIVDIVSPCCFENIHSFFSKTEFCNHRKIVTTHTEDLLKENDLSLHMNMCTCIHFHRLICSCIYLEHIIISHHFAGFCVILVLPSPLHSEIYKEEQIGTVLTKTFILLSVIY